MKTPAQMPPPATTPQQQNQQSNTGRTNLLFVSKIGQIDVVCMSIIYREVFAGKQRTDVISIVNVIDLDDNSKHKLVCSTFLERDLLKFGNSLKGKRLRITNLGQEPGKKWYRLKVDDLGVATPSAPPSQPQQISDEDIPF